MHKRFCTVLCLALLAGCGLHYAAPAGHRPPDYGRATWQQQAEAIAKHYFQKNLTYPHGARYRFEKVYRGHWYNPLEQNKAGTWGKVYYGYILKVHANAKNWSGRYVGEKKWVFVIRDGLVVYQKRYW